MLDEQPYSWVYALIGGVLRKFDYHQFYGADDPVPLPLDEEDMTYLAIKLDRQRADYRARYEAVLQSVQRLLSEHGMESAN